MSFQVRHTHASGRFDRSPKSLLVSLLWFASISGLVTTTEGAGKARVRILNRIPGFDHFKFHACDAAVLWRSSRFKALARRGMHVGTVSEGARRSIAASTVVLKRRRGKTRETIVVSSVHLPSDVEAAISKMLAGRPTPRGTQYHAIFTEWYAEVQEVADEFDADFVIMACDSNLDYFKPWVQRFADNNAPRVHVGWNGHLPKRGTHGKRLIDWSLLSHNLKVKRIRVLGRKVVTRASDHRAFTEVIRSR